MLLKFKSMLIACMCVFSCALPITRSKVSNLQAFVSGGSLVSISSTAPIPDQLKNDFLESTLYAQVNASSQYDRHFEGNMWHEAYVIALQHLGWSIPLSDLKAVNMKDTFNWKNNIEDVFNFTTDPVEYESLDNVINAYLHLPATTAAVKLFTDWSSQGDLSNFLLIPGFVNKTGGVVSHFGFFDIVQIKSLYDAEVTGLLASVLVGTFNEFEYGKHREEIHKQLAEHLQEDIIALDL